MKRHLMLSLVIAVLAAGCISIHATDHSSRASRHETTNVTDASQQEASCSDDSASRVLRHVVLFSYTEQTTAAEAASIREQFLALKDDIAEIIAVEGGSDVSTEGLSQGFAHAFVVTFADAAARDAYLPHAAHQAFVTAIKPHLEKVLVIDYFSTL